MGIELLALPSLHATPKRYVDFALATVASAKSHCRAVPALYPK